METMELESSDRRNDHGTAHPDPRGSRGGRRADDPRLAAQRRAPDLGAGRGRPRVPRGARRPPRRCPVGLQPAAVQRPRRAAAAARAQRRSPVHRRQRHARRGRGRRRCSRTAPTTISSRTASAGSGRPWSRRSARAGSRTKSATAERSAADSARQWQATFDAISDPIFLLDCERTIVRCNRPASSCSDRAPEALGGQTPCSQVRCEFDDPAECPMRRMAGSLHRETSEVSAGDRWYLRVGGPALRRGARAGRRRAPDGRHHRAQAPRGPAQPVAEARVPRAGSPAASPTISTTC